MRVWEEAMKGESSRGSVVFWRLPELEQAVAKLG